MHVPEDITQEILLRLPVKSLLRFTTVCNSWRNLILSDQFIDSHTKFGRCMEIVLSTERRRSTVHPDKRLRFHIPEHKILESEFQSIPLSRTLHLNQYYHVIGHCNGIICLSRKMGNPTTILLWNPALRQCRALPETDIHHVYFMGFCYDPQNNDFKVVKTSYKFRDVMIYSLRNDSWRSIDCSQSHHRFVERGVVDFSYSGLFFEGRLYWIWRKLLEPVYWLLVFDMVTEEFREVHLSDTFDERNHILAYTLGIFRGCVSLLTRRRDSGKQSFEIWSMEDHCIPMCWTKVVDSSSSSSMMVTVNKEFLGLLELVKGWPWSTGLTTDGKVFAELFANGESCLVLYDVETQRLNVNTSKRNHKEECRWFAITDFVETLVSVTPRVNHREMLSCGQSRLEKMDVFLKLVCCLGGVIVTLIWCFCFIDFS